jgi:hypothetical protein
MEKKIELKTGDTAVYIYGVNDAPNWIVRAYRKLIVTFTNSIFVHMGTIVIKYGRLYILEATSVTGVVLRPLEKDEEIFIIQTGDEKKSEEIEKYLEDKVGKDYGYLDAIVSIFKLNNVDNTKWFCSELTWTILTKILGYKLSRNMTPGGVVYDLLSKYGKSLIHYKHKG